MAAIAWLFPNPGKMSHRSREGVTNLPGCPWAGTFDVVVMGLVCVKRLCVGVSLSACGTVRRGRAGGGLYRRSARWVRRQAVSLAALTATHCRSLWGWGEWVVLGGSCVP